MTTARVYIVDDDEQMCRLVRRQLEPDHDAVCFAEAERFLEVASALAKGCLILDLHLPRVNGLDVLRWLTERHLRFPTVMITGRGDVTIAVQAMKAGAVDFVEKPFTRETIRAAIRLAQARLTAAGKTGDDPVLAKTRLALLSGREIEVLNGLVAGLPNKTIAYDLGLSPRTVEVHRANIMHKMQAGSFSALVRSALAAGVRVNS